MNISRQAQSPLHTISDSNGIIAASNHGKTPVMLSNICPNSPSLNEKRSPKRSDIVKYMECLKNHAAAIGGKATDGCGEFLPGGEESSLEALICAACDCHRNFHKKILIERGYYLPEMGVKRADNEVVKKRLRTKFSQEHKEKMLGFAEKSEWKIQNVDEYEVSQFCQEIGVKRKVLRIWMHNNKYNYLAKKNSIT
ncbi:zinc-finger homeodomain 3-like [Olea europaea subsp. europaea]|uniref:Zinc-finger homeodomain 3-like n=1 Tax=Olea europaea subsp. europaea TaxID=158383 RepID=A0A8S0P816_OLEEU|nr:zinc-finger homeodomain 3-like [Olea europaea subsp. europaea]